MGNESGEWNKKNLEIKQNHIFPTAGPYDKIKKLMCLPTSACISCESIVVARLKGGLVFDDRQKNQKFQ